MTFNLLILSDSHLFGSRKSELFGVNSYHSLQKLTEHIRKSEKQFDLIIALGDLSEDGKTGAYEDFHGLTVDLAPSAIWLQGNHDRFENLTDALSLKYVKSEFHWHSWSIIFVDTTLEGRDEGKVGGKERQRLINFLESNASQHILIFMHHYPMDVGSQFIDELGLKNNVSFWEIVSPHQKVRGIVSGHVHQASEKQIHGIRLFSAPSTTIQFKPHSKELAFDSLPPGYMTIRLNEDGSFNEEFVRIPINDWRISLK